MKAIVKELREFIHLQTNLGDRMELIKIRPCNATNYAIIEINYDFLMWSEFQEFINQINDKYSVLSIDFIGRNKGGISIFKYK